MTETPVGSSFYYTKMEQMGSYTGIVVKQCPEFARLFSGMPVGGWDEKVSCRIGEQGQCETDDPDYCMDGEDFKCPPGTIRTGAAKGKSLENCGTCAPGKQCGGTTPTNCPVGYLCPGSTSTARGHPAQNGSIATDGVTPTVCLDSYCIGNEGAKKTCPNGYRNPATAWSKSRDN